MKKAILSVIALAIALFSMTVSAPPIGTAQPKPDAKTYATGHKDAPDLAAKIKASWKRHGARLSAAPKVTAPSWDCRTLGLVPPVVNQGDCGSCWDFAGSGMVTSYLLKAGYGKPDGTFRISEQFTLDCGRNGGCNGDDLSTVCDWAKDKGLPLEKDYGPYQNGRIGLCKQVDPLLFFKIEDWGYCSGDNGVAATQAIKNAMVQYGPIGSAIAADNAFMNVKPGQVFKGNSSSINHDIILIGWDDAKGAWLLRNSWGADWCDGGYCWIAYGANQVGYAAAWGVAAPLPLPPAPPVPPVPPGPVPPTPPVPGGASTFTINGPLAAGSYQIVPAGSITINSSMSLKDFADALEKASKGPQAVPSVSAPCPTSQRLDRLEKVIERLESVLTGKK